jgi:hypothetical protein
VHADDCANRSLVLADPVLSHIWAEMGWSAPACLFGSGRWVAFLHFSIPRGRIRTCGVRLGRPAEDAQSDRYVVWRRCKRKDKMDDPGGLCLLSYYH